MSRLVLPREERVHIAHPETMRGAFNGGEKWLRLDHEIVRSLQQGYGDWHGDERYAIYAVPERTTAHPKGQWVLVRLAHNGRYVAERVYEGDEFSASFEFLARLIRDLQEHDVRRGYDPIADVARHNEALERRQDRDFSDFTSDFADHYLYRELKKAGADAYL